MKKVLIVILIVLCIVLLSMVIPWIASNYANKYLNISETTKLLSAICSLATLVIAILLFNKYVINSKLIEKKIQRVFKLIEEFNKIELIVQLNNSIGPNPYRIIFVRFNDKDAKKLIKDFSNMPVYFMFNFTEVAGKINSLCNDPFMPNNIVEAAKPLRVAIFTPIQNKAPEYAIVSCPSNKKSKINIVGVINKEEMTLDEIINAFENIRKEIKKWMKDNSSGKLDINF